MAAPSYDFDAEVSTWPEVSDEAKARLAALMRPSGRGLARIDQQDVDEVLDTVRELAEVSS